MSWNKLSKKHEAKHGKHDLVDAKSGKTFKMGTAYPPSEIPGELKQWFEPVPEPKAEPKKSAK